MADPQFEHDEWALEGGGLGVAYICVRREDGEASVTVLVDLPEWLQHQRLFLPTLARSIHHVPLDRVDETKRSMVRTFERLLNASETAIQERGDLEETEE